MVVTPSALLFILLGVMVGEIVGSFRNIFAAAVALLLPATYALGPVVGAHNACRHLVWEQLGVRHSILLDIPGEATP